MNPLISIVVCYRDREEHLQKFIPHMKEIFKGFSYEIIVVEQNDDLPFKRGVLLNEGARIAKGAFIAFHDVDYLPSSADHYFDIVDVTQPVKFVDFVNMDGSPRNESDVPSGYRHFKNGVDNDFYGAVTVFKRDAFFKINGFNSLYNGWGLEDADLRERIKYYGLTVTRNGGRFQALPHKDSFPGINDSSFQHNNQLFNKWSTLLGYGVNTQKAVRSVHQLEDYTWIKASNFTFGDLSIIPFLSLQSVTDYYEDDPEKHTAIWNTFKKLVNDTPVLKAHRDFVVNYGWGYGNRAFHWMWRLLVEEAPDDFKILEIGVFKGQTISLISMLNKLFDKKGTVYGISPLNKDGDHYNTHPDIDYEEAISTIYGQFQLDASDLQLMEGYSNDKNIINVAQSEGPYDIIYVDGCHDYSVVVSDLTNYGNMVKLNGYLVIDDASNYLNIPDGLIRLNWRGLEDVSNATRDVTEKDNRFKEVFAVGHNRIFKRIS